MKRGKSLILSRSHPRASHTEADGATARAGEALARALRSLRKILDSIAWREFVFGLITRKDLFLHPVTVYRDYGWRVLVMGLLRHRGTFLELVARHPVNVPVSSAGHAPD